MLFLKQLDETGQNLLVTQSQKKFVGIDDALDQAIAEDLLSDNDLDLLPNGSKRALTD